jgi:AcrR family transcriptional regulator
MSRTVKPPEIRKQELIDAAKRLFLQNGYNATTVRDILKEVDGAPGMFYYYFDSKLDIYKEAMKQNLGAYAAEMTETLCNQAVPIPDRILTALQKFKCTFFSYSNGAERLILNKDPDFILQIKHIVCTALAEATIKMLTEGLENGTIRNESLKLEEVPRIAAFIIFGFAGLVHYELEIEDGSTEEAIQGHINWLLSYIAPLLGFSLPFDRSAT